MADNTRSHDLRRLEESLKESWKESLKEIMTKMQSQDESISALNLQQNHLMARFQQEQNGPILNGHGQGAVRNQYFSTRQTKVDFPRFNGEDLNGWIYRCQQFFDVDGTPPESKVKLAVINLEGRTLQWHQNWRKYKG